MGTLSLAFPDVNALRATDLLNLHCVLVLTVGIGARAILLELPQPWLWNGDVNFDGNDCAIRNDRRDMRPPSRSSGQSSLNRA